ncbi:hypothetical protein M758_UG071500 [Ceratodon purpureus]|nr:hypothetical protein M758_UG071500 [Ceratodon purpureus]
MKARHIEPVSLEIPLCRLRPTTWVRQALKADVQTVYEGFSMGNWGSNFWVTTSGTPPSYPDPNFEDRARCAGESELFDAHLKEQCEIDEENRALYKSIIGRYVHVWVWALAWMKHIADFNGDPIKVSCFVLNESKEDRGWISNFMRDN